MVGLIAAVYANGSDKAPVRYWGQREHKQSVRVRNDRWAATRVVREGVLHVHLRKDANFFFYNDENPRTHQDWFIPMDRLGNLTVEF